MPAAFQPGLRIGAFVLHRMFIDQPSVGLAGLLDSRRRHVQPPGIEPVSSSNSSATVYPGPSVSVYRLTAVILVYRATLLPSARHDSKRV